jgi:phosphatidylglycerol:prolipoprotein diacylglycerol transferase
MHPILFRIGGLTIGTYGVAIVAGMLGALWLSGRLARRRGLIPDFIYDLAFRLLLFGFLGARLLYIILNWREFLADPLGLLFSRQGFVFQGGFIAALAAGIWYTRRHKVPLLGAADIIAPALALAHGFGRIGCFFAGCCYGKVCPPEHSTALERLLSVRYPLDMDHGQISNFNFAYFGQIERGLIPQGAAGPLPILPVQLFEAFGNFVICAVLLWMWKRQKFSGQVFALYMLLYSVLRFGLEFLRGDAERGLWLGGMISTGQSIAICTFAAGVVLWMMRKGTVIDAMPDLTPAAAEEAAPAAVAQARKAAAPAPERRRK